MQLLLTGTARARTKTFAIDVYVIADDPVVSTTTVEYAEIPEIRVDRIEIGYGNMILASHTELVVEDPTGAVRDRFGATFSEDEYLVHIHGTGFSWKGRIQKSTRQRPISGRIYPTGTTVLRVYDRLGGLAQRLASSSIEYTLGDLVADALFEANSELPIHWHLDAWPSNIFANDVRLLRFTTELVGTGRGNYGKQKEQLEKVALFHGLRIFQSTSDASWRVFHRPSTGEARTAAQKTVFGEPYTWSTEDVPADSFALDAADVQAEDSDILETEPRVGKVLLTGEGEAELATDGNFDFWSSVTDLTFWENFAITRSTDVPGLPSLFSAQMNDAGGGPGLEAFIYQDVIQVSPETNVRVRFRCYSVGLGDGVSTFGALELRIILFGNSGIVYYQDSAGAWQTVDSFIDLNPTDSLWTAETHVSTADFPEAGTLRARLNGELVRVTQLSVTFEDNLGAAITDWAVSIGDGQGVTVEMERAEAMEADTTGAGAWAPPADWDSTRYGVNYGSLGEFQASDRLYQQQDDLKVLDCKLWGLHGPQRRLTYDADDDGVTETFLPVGLILSLEEETTRGVWIELPAAIA